MYTVFYQGSAQRVHTSYLRRQVKTNVYLIKNCQAVRKGCGLQKNHGEKRCEIQGGSQVMVVMVG